MTWLSGVCTGVQHKAEKQKLPPMFGRAGLQPGKKETRNEKNVLLTNA
jgi:hypothetical protein